MLKLLENLYSLVLKSVTLCCKYYWLQPLIFKTFEKIEIHISIHRSGILAELVNPAIELGLGKQYGRYETDSYRLS